jgi:hypothetical protein
MLKDFLKTWEELEDGRIQGQVCGQEILIDQVLIHEQLGISKESKNHFEEDCTSTCFVENE